MWIGFVFDECVGDGYGGSGGSMDFTRLCLGLVLDRTTGMVLRKGLLALVFYTFTVDESDEEVEPSLGADGDTDDATEFQFESDEARADILKGGDKDLET
ncbi:hypothetical protein Q3G72_032626 [Acer saccharum]|nr:hypothetical protein Q3G72_032626 [Acer saccharum]